MNNEQTNASLKDSVLTKIKRGEVSMRPRAYFVLQTILLLVLAVAIIMLSAFVVNFMLFALQVQGHQSLLDFGPRGIIVFLLVFPWAWFLLDLVCIALATVLVHRFRLAYRRPTLYIGAALFFLALLVGVVIESGTPLNDTLLHDADHHDLPPPISNLYEGIHEGPPHDLGVFRGIVTSVGTSSFIIAHDDFDHDQDDGSFAVIPPPSFDLNSLAPGDRVYIAGTSTLVGINAYGVQILPQAPGSK